MLFAIATWLVLAWCNAAGSVSIVVAAHAANSLAPRPVVPHKRDEPDRKSPLRVGEKH
jgi:hypothetical protein